MKKLNDSIADGANSSSESQSGRDCAWIAEEFAAASDMGADNDGPAFVDILNQGESKDEEAPDLAQRDRN